MNKAESIFKLGQDYTSDEIYELASDAGLLVEDTKVSEDLIILEILECNHERDERGECLAIWAPDEHITLAECRATDIDSLFTVEFIPSEIEATAEAPAPVLPKIKIENMRGPSGKEAPNQFRIQTDDGMYFQSYKSIVAFRSLEGRVYLDRDTWNYSKTTGRYRNDFLGERQAATEAKIASGEYILADLN